MKLWILMSKKNVDYDMYYGFVIRAESSRKARALASEKDTFSSDIWASSKTSSCKELTPSGKPGIVLDSNKGG